MARLREQGKGGSLTLIGSPAGQRGNFGQTAYTAPKAGIAAMDWTWAAELARDSITVNAVIPVVFTRMVELAPHLAGLVEAIGRGEPIPDETRRHGLGLADDVAPLVVFLASPAAAGIRASASASEVTASPCAHGSPRSSRRCTTGVGASRRSPTRGRRPSPSITKYRRRLERARHAGRT